jgi:hypothetical protein
VIIENSCETHFYLYIFYLESQKERDHWEDIDVDVRIILRLLRELGWRSKDWINLTQDRDQ